MNPEHFNRLHQLRMENVAAGFYLDEQRARFDGLRNRHENGTAPRAVSVFQLFQTPEPIAQKLVDLLDPAPGAIILEPSAGLGRILDALKPRRPSKVFAVDIAPECTRELYKQDRDRVVIKQRDFLTLDPSEIGQVDYVAMNPPFHLRADIKHTLHALKFLRPGGRLAGVCMLTYHREEQLKPLCKEWYDLEPGTFKESNTNISAVLFTIET